MEAGVTVCGICDMVGVAEANYYKWFQYADDFNKDNIYRQFRQSIKKAEGRCEIRLVLKIEQDSSWQSKAWIFTKIH